MSKRQRHTCSGAGCGVTLANEAANYSYRIVPALDSQRKYEEMEAMWDCASQLWVPGRSLVHGRPYLRFCPITL